MEYNTSNDPGSNIQNGDQVKIVAYIWNKMTDQEETEGFQFCQRIYN